MILLPLSRKRELLKDLSLEELQKLISDIRYEVAKDKYAFGDDRCWLDKFRYFRYVEGLPTAPIRPPHLAMRECELYYSFCRSEDARPIKIRMPKRSFFSKDLKKLSREDSLNILISILGAIYQFGMITGRPITYHDYQELYDAVLPEKTPGNFWLPPREEFLGDAKKCAGCPHFWQSHARCTSDVCELGQWGPCHDSLSERLALLCAEAILLVLAAWYVLLKFWGLAKSKFKKKKKSTD